MRDDNWTQEALCADLDAAESDELFFPEVAGRGSMKKARAKAWDQACRKCPVRVQCLREALKQEMGYTEQRIGGIWAGTTSYERSQLLLDPMLARRWVAMIERGEAPWDDPESRLPSTPGEKGALTRKAQEAAEAREKAAS